MEDTITRYQQISDAGQDVSKNIDKVQVETISIFAFYNAYLDMKLFLFFSNLDLLITDDLFENVLLLTMLELADHWQGQWTLETKPKRQLKDQSTIIEYQNWLK